MPPNVHSTHKPDSFNPESMLKGRMAETLVEELLKKSGNHVYRFGHEAIVQNLGQLKESYERDGEAGERISTMPDFIVLDGKNNSVFVEVKFRKDGKLFSGDVARLRRIRDLWRASVIFVNSTTRPFFRVTSPEYFDEHGTLQWRPLAEEELWRIDRGLYAEYEALVSKYFGGPPPSRSGETHESRPAVRHELEVDLRQKAREMGETMSANAPMHVPPHAAP